MQEGAWLTNFSIFLVLTAVAPQLIIGNNLPIQLLEHFVTDTRVLSSSIFDVLHMNNANVIMSSRVKPWGRAPITNILKGTEHVLTALSVDNNHWVALRTSKQFNLVELFLFMQTEHEQERAHLYAQQLVSYLIAVGHLCSEPTYVFRTSPEWWQHDGSSCGLYTLGVLVSLIQGRRISLDCCKRPCAWRRYFAQIVVTAVEDNAHGHSSSDSDAETTVDLTAD